MRKHAYCVPIECESNKPHSTYSEEWHTEGTGGPVLFNSSMYHWTCLARTVIIVAYRVHSLVRLVLHFLLWQHARHFPALQKPVGMKLPDQCELDISTF